MGFKRGGNNGVHRRLREFARTKQNGGIHDREFSFKRDLGDLQPTLRKKGSFIGDIFNYKGNIAISKGERGVFGSFDILQMLASYEVALCSEHRISGEEGGITLWTRVCI